jgi:hypothetical protein
MKLITTVMMMFLAAATVVQAQELSVGFVAQTKFVTGGRFGFVSDMLVGGTPVQGAPYSAEAVTENVQTLADGNRIVQKSTSMLYRDSLGRERREQTLSAIGPFTAQGDPLEIITISDPVAGVNYSLNSKEHVVIKLPALPPLDSLEAGVTRKLEVIAGGPATAPLGLAGPITINKGGTPAGVRAAMWVDGRDPAPKTEQLGWKLIEGVQAEGMRRTISIPAGEIGNERPIEIVDEEWRSPDLQLIVLSKHSDPRIGENVYSLKNISRSEPSPELFQVPAGYTVRDKPTATIERRNP